MENTETGTFTSPPSKPVSDAAALGEIIKARDAYRRRGGCPSYADPESYKAYGEWLDAIYEELVAEMQIKAQRQNKLKSLLR